LDRDGVLNKLIVDREQGTVDSPLHPDQVELLPGVPEALNRLNRAGYGLAIVTNQPSFAKGKTTRENLAKTQMRVVELAQKAGAVILSSHICYHRSEDDCSCRKPRIGLLEEAFAKNNGYSKGGSWIVGDGVTDIQAGHTFGLQTAMVSRHKVETASVLKEKGLTPTLWVEDLGDFCDQLLSP
jgi:histidinol-phosphate phosphatase family protein